MAKKTKAGGKIKSASKSIRSDSATTSKKSWKGDDEHDNKFGSRGKAQEKFQSQRIAKKRG